MRLHTDTDTHPVYKGQKLVHQHNNHNEMNVRYLTKTNKQEQWKDMNRMVAQRLSVEDQLGEAEQGRAAISLLNESPVRALK